MTFQIVQRMLKSCVFYLKEQAKEKEDFFYYCHHCLDLPLFTCQILQRIRKQRDIQHGLNKLNTMMCII